MLPDERGRGYGKALLTALGRLAVERDCGRLEWSVLDWNEPSIQFYKSLGAVPKDEWTINRVTGEALEQLGEDGAADLILIVPPYNPRLSVRPVGAVLSG